ncbi:MAG: hypothetical protein ABJL44_15465 [Algibacter sp.]
MTNKINIFYIEDNPKPEDILIRDLEYPDSELFNLFIFQHPIDLYEYLQSIGKLNTNTLASDCPEAIPSIVIFDYQMSDNLIFNEPGSFKYTNTNHLRFLKTKNISLLLKNKFVEQLSDNKLLIEEEDFSDTSIYRQYYDFSTDFKLNFKANKGDDEFGLFMGISLLKQFENIPIFCQPATSAKSDKKNLSKSAKFYEWINSVNTGKSTGKNISDKDWDKLLNASLFGLRDRIRYQVEKGIITPNYNELKEFISDDFNLKPQSSFHFSSQYGDRKLNLNSLFYDKDKKSISSAIKKWSRSLLSAVDIKSFETAKEKSKELIDAYKGGNLIRQRNRLSYLILKNGNKDLAENEIIELENLKSKFGINNTVVDNYFSKKKKNTGINNEVKEFRNYSNYDSFTQRLIVLFTDIRLHKLWGNYVENNRNSSIATDILSKYSDAPTTTDLIYALFPIPKNPLILFHHQDLANEELKNKIPNIKNKDTFHKALKDQLGKDYYQNTSPFFNNLNSIEKSFCLSLILELELAEKYQPEYLKS